MNAVLRAMAKLATVASLAAVGVALDGVVSKAQAAASSVEASVRRIESSSSAGRKAAADLARDLTELDSNANTVLDQLMARFKEEGVAVGEFGKEIQLQLDLLAVGGTTVEAFMALFGQTVVVTRDGMQTIQQLLAGVDFRQYSNEIQGLINALLRAKISVGEALDFLAEKGGVYAEALRKIVQQVIAGEAKLSELQAFIQRLKEVFGESDLTALADAFFQQLAQGKP